MKTLGERIYRLRKFAGLTEEELAGRLGVKKEIVLLWENDDLIPTDAQMDALFREVVKDAPTFSFQVQPATGNQIKTKRRKNWQTAVAAVLIVALSAAVISLSVLFAGSQKNKENLQEINFVTVAENLTELTIPVEVGQVNVYRSPNEHFGVRTPALYSFSAEGDAGNFEIQPFDVSIFDLSKQTLDVFIPTNNRLDTLRIVPTLTYPFTAFPKVTVDGIVCQNLVLNPDKVDFSIINCTLNELKTENSELDNDIVNLEISDCEVEKLNLSDCSNLTIKNSTIFSNCNFQCSKANLIESEFRNVTFPINDWVEVAVDGSSFEDLKISGVQTLTGTFKKLRNLYLTDTNISEFQIVLPRPKNEYRITFYSDNEAEYPDTEFLLDGEKQKFVSGETFGSGEHIIELRGYRYKNSSQITFAQ